MSQSTERKSVQILLVEDNEADVELTRQGLLDARLCNDLYVVHDGQHALDFLRQAGEFSDAPRPDLVLLDINLPGLTGEDVLREAKSDSSLADIPIVVLTTSSDERDIKGAYRLHANSFVTKPVQFTEFVRAIRELTGYWFELVRLPTQPGPQ